ncbi:MAG: DinB family protein [Gemmatimonadota bacterium]
MTHITDVHAAEYDDYTSSYIARIEDGTLTTNLEHSRDRVLALWSSLRPHHWSWRPEPGRWTPSDIAQHQIDVERVFAYRILRFSRGDETALPGFDVDDFAAAAGAENRPPAELIDDFRIARDSTLALVRSLHADALTHGGTASGSFISARAAAFKLCGHDHHHCDVMEQQYLSGVG